jgi:CelD/BcsL family acetyltransferase involved in cellulose biosynthesis
LNAESGILRCHVLLAGEQPCAFSRGFIKGDMYYYDTPGFDPGFSKASPGTVLLLRVIEDLIVNTECRVLDFGIGGGNSGYKKILGNRCYEAVSLEVGRRWDPYARLLFGIQGAVNFTKRFGESVLGKDYLKRIAKRILRKYGSR